jgi:RimJ/RimL family protein N-acetyltransferase
MGKIILETARLTLSTWETGDVDLVHDLHSTIDTTRYLSGGRPWSREKAEERLCVWIEDYNLHGISKFKIISRDSGEFLGRAGFSYFQRIKSYELGYSFHRTAWGKGYATEAARGLSGWFFENGFDDHFTVFANLENLASTNVMEKIGMVEIGPVEIDGDACRNFRMTAPEKSV